MKRQIRFDWVEIGSWLAVIGAIPSVAAMMTIWLNLEAAGHAYIYADHPVWIALYAGQLIQLLGAAGLISGATTMRGDNVGKTFWQKATTFRKLWWFEEVPHNGS